MTAQSHEIVMYNGKFRQMASEPLKDYLATRDDVKFIVQSTACWRAYLGSWVIKDKRLYLNSLIATIDSAAHVDFIEIPKKVGLEYLFPGKKEVFAAWYTGEIIIPTGELLEYVHAGYESVYEKDIILQIVKGVLVSEEYIDNRELLRQQKLETKRWKEAMENRPWWKKLFEISVERNIVMPKRQRFKVDGDDQ